MSDAALADGAQADASFTPVSVHVPPRVVVHASPAPTASAANCIIADPEGTVLAAASVDALRAALAPVHGWHFEVHHRAALDAAVAAVRAEASEPGDEVLVACHVTAVNEWGREQPRALIVGRSGVYRVTTSASGSTVDHVRKSGYDSVRFVEATGECLRLFGSERSERADSSEARILGSAESIGSISRSIASGLAIATGSKKANADEFENMREYKPQVLATPPLTKPHVAHVLSCAIVAASRLHGNPVERITEEKRVAALRTRKNTGGGFAL